MTKKLLPVFCAAAILFSFNSCSKKTTVNPSDSVKLTLEAADENSIFNEPVNKEITNKKIIVLLGYAFNSEETKNQFINVLDQKYGLSDNDALILPLVYPDDFKREGRSFATEFYNIISGENIDVAGIITLGAPEYTHVALARNQDYWDEQVPYPVIALFPQDDVLGTESTCDIILDKGQSVAIEEDIKSQQDDEKIAETALPLLIDVINYIRSADFSLQNTAEAKNHAEQMFKNINFHNYTDPESGLKSINHFVLN